MSSFSLILECSSESFSSSSSMCKCSLTTSIVLFVIHQLPQKIPITFISSKESESCLCLYISKETLAFSVSEKKIPVSCPALYNETQNYYIAGLSSVLRFLIKHHCGDSNSLLGFQGGCLSSTSESSNWTHFVEVEVLLALNSIRGQGELKVIPEAFSRFETQLSQPLKINNIRKRMQDHFKERGKEIEKVFSEDPLSLYASTNHFFAEGPDLLLSDLLLFLPTFLFLQADKDKICVSLLPKVSSWAKLMSSVVKIPNWLQNESLLSSSEHWSLTSKTIISKLPANRALYSDESKRRHRASKKKTRQIDIDRIRGCLTESLMSYESLTSTPLNWSTIPSFIHPKDGDLPAKRLLRKCQQLESCISGVRLCEPKAGDVIVDFCSGGGHLGILLAYLFPNCTVHLIENKERSLTRAVKRVEGARLSNITFFQCNLDYYKESFNIGVSLHACGSSTDLVLYLALGSKADFVGSPCCYGSIKESDKIYYPLSRNFRDQIPNLQDYLVMSHTADQFSSEEDDKMKDQGHFAMTMIDSDRAFKLKEVGYDVRLTKMIPSTCSPKNNLIIGKYRERKSNREEKTL